VRDDTAHTPFTLHIVSHRLSLRFIVRPPRNAPAMSDKDKKRKQEPVVEIANEADFVGEHSDRVITKVSNHQLIYSLAGLVLGLACIIGGIILFLAGVSGKMSWTAKFLGASSEILDAAPGAVLFIVGLFTVFVTRFRIRSKR
jgi:hypothetical protein